MNYRLAASATLLAAVFAVAPATAQPAKAYTGADVLKALNKDGDNTLELSEAINAGVKVFEAINPDGDTTLESNETAGRITTKDWQRANKDGDKTLEMDEWLSILRKRFARADPDKDGSLDEAELNTKAGQQVVLMIMK